jgi:hypothetical protein
VVSFTPRPLYPQGKSPLYPLDRRLGGLYKHEVEKPEYLLQCIYREELYIKMEIKN